MAMLVSKKESYDRLIKYLTNNQYLFTVEKLREGWIFKIKE
jgi:hypothetical protein